LKIVAGLMALVLTVALGYGQDRPAAEFIFAPGSEPFAQCHASTVVTLANGELMAAWFGGASEGAPDVAIWGSRRVAGHWTEPKELVREKNVATWNPVLFHTNDGRLWLYYKVGPAPNSWSAARMVSGDEGRTWSASEAMPAGLLGPIRAKPLVLADGTIVSGTSFEAWQTWAAWVERSTDAGKTWAKLGPIAISREMDAATAPALDAKPGTLGWNPDAHPREYSGVIQPSIVQLDGGHLRMYLRTRTLAAKIAVSDSLDDGLTWSKARFLELPSNNSGLDVVRLKDGRLVMIFNDTTSGRTPLNLAVSRDGEHFKVFRTLEDGAGEYSYPALVEAADGGLEMTYTWQRKSIKYVHVPLSEVPKP